MSLKIFISSVQKEFAEERTALRDFLRGDALLRRFFAVRDGFVTTLWRQAARPESQPESRPESQPESRPESLEARVLGLLSAVPLSKAEISAELGHKEVSGQLNKIIRLLLAEQNVEHTIPDKPNSRLQKYRLTGKGVAMLAALRKGTSAT